MSDVTDKKLEVSNLLGINKSHCLADIYENAVRILEDASIESAHQNVKLIMWYLFSITPTDIVVFPDKELDEQAFLELKNAIQRRIIGEPIQYICKKAPFRYTDLECRRGVFIPRPETEILVERALNTAQILLDERSNKSLDSDMYSLHMHGNAIQSQDCNVIQSDFIGVPSTTSDKMTLQIADICSGSGTIAVSVASECEQAQVFATDISKEAVELTQLNAQKLEVDDRVRAMQGNLFEPLGSQKFDLILSNPPYIPTKKIQNMPHEVVDFEPMAALDGGLDGLDIFRKIVSACSKHLNEGGFLICELDEDTLEQAHEICQNSKDIEFGNVKIVHDLAGRNRIIEARRRA